jgi:hypothetical protein
MAGLAILKHTYDLSDEFKRANRMLKKLRTYLGRVIRDIGVWFRCGLL